MPEGSAAQVMMMARGAGPGSNFDFAPADYESGKTYQLHGS
jgi:hypothetical protein